ncbi:MAG: hypothetical protein KDD42_08915 [Bdellovibrionales bacterium]|nr:hypothetical protein [Bdellovibrionales bacterium]
MAGINIDLDMSTLLGLVLAVQIGLAIYMVAALRISRREVASLNKEMFGLLRKLEGLTSSKREQMLKHYDRILESVANRLPTTIAAHTSETIFEAESKILARLAELEPRLKDGDETSRQKMDDLIRTMEGLEQTIVALTADTVRKIMVDSRKNLLEMDFYSDDSLAA